MAVRSQVCPSAGNTGSTKHVAVMGPMKASGHCSSSSQRVSLLGCQLSVPGVGVVGLENPPHISISTRSSH